MPLPFELMLLVAKSLLFEVPTLSNLAQTSSRLYVSTLPILYEQVELSSYFAIMSFCEAIVNSHRQNGPLVKILRIRNKNNPHDWLHLSKELALSLRAAFSRLPNLRDLTIITTTSDFATFSCLDYPFKFERAQFPCVDSAGLYEFLSRQSSITELLLVSLVFRESPFSEFALLASPNLNILPRLRSITAPLQVLITMVPRRSLSEIIVESNTRALVRVSKSVLNTVFFSSKAPLDSIGYCHSAPHSMGWDSKDPWSVMIAMLKLRKAQRALAKIRIFETSRNQVTSFNLYTEWSY